MKRLVLITTLSLISISLFSQGRIRDYGIEPGIFRTGEHNAITDVPGVKVGQITIIKGDNIRTGVTAIIPHEGNLFRLKCPAAVYAGNGFGKLAGVTQIEELGNTESPIILTNTLSVAQGIEGIITYTLAQQGNESVGSVNAVVGETNDGGLNDIRGRHVTAEHVLKAIEIASGGPVEEGSVGAGTGTICFGFKGGIGTSSRVLPKSLGGYTVGVLVQSNYGGVLEVDGVPIGEMLGQYSFKKAVEEEKSGQDPQLNPDGSCMMVVITDAPVDARNLKRIAKRAMMGLAKTGGIASNGSGDYVIALSVNKDNLISESTATYNPTLLHNDDMSALFEATIEATAEALWNSLFMATDVTGIGGRTVKALPVEKVVKLMGKQK
ncbi:MAG TPA: P1 family peptidase [Bacteroidales bacterium]|mgnify:CR=1 FL=1|jgi:D-aminopeptidase|nr:P1 family peptidase [Bacteroidales bacterium]HPK29954.1 P1 family peptidase [Bacteroidales bacterium]